ncbi:hypothetical protein LTR56_025069 [Elasticomyces elasticus]|nr:hypothetical protein LTR56_025069 [Elasticomyces elasticus]KAK4905044.1 hypothetical protein LTR49_025602 [Elasticomyces elasticus]
MITLTPDDKATTSGLERQTSHGCASSESDSPRTGGSTGRKCASRIRTRRVTALSASQVERKRTHDREAQRAIRRRTKEHIERLEKTASGLRGSQESNEKILAVTQQRNQDLEDEIAYLRSKLHEGGYVPGAPLVHNYLPGAPTSIVTMPNQKPMPDSLTLSAWRSHDETSNAHIMQTQPLEAQDEPIPYHLVAYHSVRQPKERDWAAVLQHHQHPVISDAQRFRLDGVLQIPSLTPAIVDEPYAYPPAHTYTRSPLPPMTPQQQTHPPAQLPQQADHQGMGVLGHQVHPSHSYQHTTQQQPYPQPQPQAPPQAYQQAIQLQRSPMQGDVPGVAGSNALHGGMQPPSIPAVQHQTSSTPHQYTPQMMHPSLQYGDEGAGHTLTVSQYPPD